MAGPSILHLASHVVVDESTPMMSAVLLSDAPTDPDDGVVYLHELMGRSLTADLVVLSGCKTARGAYRSGEGSLGLHYGFRTMGAASSVSTLWLAEDKAVALLMRRFYEGIRSGLPKDEALQQAQLSYLEEAAENAVSPFFWASPVLYGNPAPVLLQGRYAGLPLRTWYALAAFVAIALPVGIYLFTRDIIARPRQFS
jgi:CHAT domain-containing protein